LGHRHIRRTSASTSLSARRGVRRQRHSEPSRACATMPPSGERRMSRDKEGLRRMYDQDTPPPCLLLTPARYICRGELSYIHGVSTASSSSLAWVCRSSSLWRSAVGSPAGSIRLRYHVSRPAATTYGSSEEGVGGTNSRTAC